ncbi:30S ribosome-binding factor RbfA [Metallumcola ferriviriculae]|uniref:Ribosome-binding factor A n=1 Tax=Metallumcola ferriviriculae TaxID=3039180 RepID=A0AAU0UPY6_9FIRM|nr:30S ribosome-binding factor RbfA [Desulfitibacteraceae bacterium MK1]
MSSLRANRVAEQMKKEIAQIIRDEVKDPRIGFVTVTGVELSKDLRHSKIFISILETDKNREDSLAGLEKATSFIRRELGQRLQLRYTPELEFRFDHSIEYGAHISKLLSEVKKPEDEDA